MIVEKNYADIVEHSCGFDCIQCSIEAEISNVLIELDLEITGNNVFLKYIHTSEDVESADCVNPNLNYDVSQIFGMNLSVFGELFTPDLIEKKLDFKYLKRFFENFNLITIDDLMIREDTKFLIGLTKNFAENSKVKEFFKLVINMSGDTSLDEIFQLLDKPPIALSGLSRRV